MKRRRPYSSAQDSMATQLAEETGTAAGANPWTGFPCTKCMVANNNIDAAACGSGQVPRAHGLTDSRAHGFTDMH